MDAEIFSLGELVGAGSPAGAVAFGAAWLGASPTPRGAEALVLAFSPARPTPRGAERFQLGPLVEQGKVAERFRLGFKEARRWYPMERFGLGPLVEGVRWIPPPPVLPRPLLADAAVLAGIPNSGPAFGSDIDMFDDLPLRFNLARGWRNLANAILRRLTTPRGSLPYAPEYGFDVRSLLNGSANDATIPTLQQEIAREVEKDPRVATCAATLVYTASSNSLQIQLRLATTAGPWRLVVAVDQLTAQVLEAAA